MSATTPNYGQGNYPPQRTQSSLWACALKQYSTWTTITMMEPWEQFLLNLLFFVVISLSIYTTYAYWDVHVENWAATFRFIRDLLFIVTHPHAFASDGTATATTPSGGIGHGG